eukprot:4257759-Pyramimonas_sp.AAC.1
MAQRAPQWENHGNGAGDELFHTRHARDTFGPREAHGRAWNARKTDGETRCGATGGRSLSR